MAMFWSCLTLSLERFSSSPMAWRVIGGPPPRANRMVRMSLSRSGSLASSSFGIISVLFRTHIQREGDCG